MLLAVGDGTGVQPTGGPALPCGSLAPGGRCDKNNCCFFPCVAVGSDKEMAARHEFNTCPLVVACTAPRTGGAAAAPAGPAAGASASAGPAAAGSSASGGPAAASATRL